MNGFGLFGKQGAVVLCYHSIFRCQKECFRQQMAQIQTEKYSRVYITFDDAFANLLDNALPILEQYQIPATIFAVADNLGEIPNWHMPQGHCESNERIMTPEQLAVISENSLIRIESHTLTHPDLAKIQSEQIRIELIESKQQLEALLGVHIESLALPHGSYNEEVLTLAQEAEYKMIYTLDPKVYDSEPGNSVIGRFSMSPDAWKIEFMLTCAGAYSWLHPWRRFIRLIRQCIHRSEN